MRDERYMRESPIVAQVLEVANKLRQWMKDPRNKPVVKQYLVSIDHHLEKCIPPSKTMQTRRKRM